MTALYAATLFLSAALLFLIQLIFGRMVLPLMGGSPAVWTTCMLFFQVVLLLGYSYAHGSSTGLAVRPQIVLHAAVTVLSLAFVPVALASTTPPSSDEPVGWLLGLLAASLGVPFFLLSTTAPLLQRWFSRTSHPAASNPYFLYAASNAGSLIALLSYPVLIEPSLTLRDQRQLWAYAYRGLCIALLFCAALAWTVPNRARPVRTERASTSWRDRLWWVALAFIPSSLLLGVTSYISTDIAAIPFLWVVPLVLYLLTFVLVFATRPALPHGWMVRAQPILVLPIFIAWYWAVSAAPRVLLLLHLAAFFVTAMVCHGELARRRPPAVALTEFYFWLAVGGALGGVLNAVLAPVLFRSVAEYPLILLAGTAVAPVMARISPRLSTTQATGLAILSGGVLAVCTLLVGSPHNESGTFTMAAVVPVSLASSVAIANSLTLRARPVLFALSLAAVLAASWITPSDRSAVLLARRDFFGVHRVKEAGEGRYHTLYHGSTIHGAQETAPERSCEPLTYYSRSGPLGEAFAATPAREGRHVGVIGLGAGSMAAYARPGERWTFFEIDPTVEQIARDTRFFRYLSACADGVRVVRGDGRLTMARVPDATFDLIVLDAFSSDAIPAHLLTREALAMYRSKLAPGGMILFHLSNRYLELAPVVGALVRDSHMSGRYATAQREADVPSAFLAASVWAATAREDRDLGDLARSSAWVPLPVARHERVWTDDYSDVWGAMTW